MQTSSNQKTTTDNECAQLGNDENIIMITVPPDETPRDLEELRDYEDVDLSDQFNLNDETLCRDKGNNEKAVDDEVVHHSANAVEEVNSSSSEKKDPTNTNDDNNLERWKAQIRISLFDRVKEYLDLIDMDVSKVMKFL